VDRQDGRREPGDSAQAEVTLAALGAQDRSAAGVTGVCSVQLGPATPERPGIGEARRREHRLGLGQQRPPWRHRLEAGRAAI
jgi:hypothetical protein